MCVWLVHPAYVESIQTGLVLVEPPPGSRGVCLESGLTFRCTTTGRGETELRFEALSSSVTPQEFLYRHSQYTPAPGTANEETRLDGELMAGNLSRSASEECFDGQRNIVDFCYTTLLVISATNSTLCGSIICTTIFYNGTADVLVEFGRLVIARSE